MKNRHDLKTLALDAFLSQYDSERPVDWAARFNRSRPLTLEIGCGLGEYLVRVAGESPDNDFIGIEQDWLRVKKTLRRIVLARRGGVLLRNIRILQIDVTVALERLFPPRSLQHVVCLFPCPWPKKSQIKHRLFSTRFLRLLNSRLDQGGDVRIVTDFRPFFDWVTDQIAGTGFEMTQDSIGPQFDTKFERKWVGQGQREFRELRLVKSEHMTGEPVKQDVPLRTFFNTEFHPEQFLFRDVTGEMTVVGKEYLYDSRARKAMVHLIVSEENITQHLWAMIRRTTRGWLVSKAEGHTVLPTAGVDYALGLVHQAVCRTAEQKND